MFCYVHIVQMENTGWVLASLPLPLGVLIVPLGPAMSRLEEFHLQTDVPVVKLVIMVLKREPLIV